MKPEAHNRREDPAQNFKNESPLGSLEFPAPNPTSTCEPEGASIDPDVEQLAERLIRLALPRPTIIPRNQPHIVIAALNPNKEPLEEFASFLKPLVDGCRYKNKNCTSSVLRADSPSISTLTITAFQNFLDAITDDPLTQRSLLEALAKFEQSEAPFRQCTDLFYKIIRKEPMDRPFYEEASSYSNRVMRIYLPRDCSSLLGSLLDPIRDLAKELNKALATSAFSNRGDGGLLYIEVDTFVQFASVPQTAEILGSALDDPQSFVLRQREQSGLLGKIHAFVDRGLRVMWRG